MRKFNFALCVVAAFGLVGSATGAHAADAAQAWGTIGSPGQAFLNSALTAEAGGTVAQQVESGRNSSPFKSVTACGTCTTITITGNQNSVSGNSINSTNFGTVSSTGIFNQDSF